MDSHNHAGNVWELKLQITKLFRIYRCSYCTKVWEVAK